MKELQVLRQQIEETAELIELLENDGQVAACLTLRSLKKKKRHLDDEYARWDRAADTDLDSKS